MQVGYEDVSSTHYTHILQHLLKLKGNSRSGGVHVSDIIKYAYFGCLPEGQDKLKKEREAAEDISDFRIFPLRMFLGMSFELFVAGLYPEMQWQPGEFSRDGITGSPDGLTRNGNKLIVEEFKFTFKSSRNKEILKETLWMWQIAAYCVLVGTRFARLHTCWVNGDYSHGEDWGPRYFRYLIEFRQFELDRIWNQVFLRNKEKMEYGTTAN